MCLYIYTQFCSVQSRPTLCDPMNLSTPGLPVHHQLPEFTQTHVHQVGDAIQPSHPLSSPSPPALNPSQHQGLFQWVNSTHYSVQSPSRVGLFATPRIVACQASLSITNSWRSLKQTSIESVKPSSISSSVVPFSSCHKSLPASESFPMSQLFAWGGQSTGVSALASFLPKNTQGWYPLEWTDWISLQSKGLSRVFPNTTVQKHQFFGNQLSSQFNSHIHTWPLEKP